MYVKNKMYKFSKIDKIYNKKEDVQKEDFNL